MYDENIGKRNPVLAFCCWLARTIGHVLVQEKGEKVGTA